MQLLPWESRLVDRNGKWPEWFHHKIIEDLFKKSLSDHAVKVLQDASDCVDSVDSGNQAPERSFMHAMRDGDNNQSVDRARELSEGYVRIELRAAIDLQIAFEAKGGKGYDDAALTRFGHALHTVTDSTSLQHIGYQPWYGMNSWSSWQHKRAEDRSSVSSERAAAEARYAAQVAASQLWLRYQAALEAERKKRQKEEQP